MNWLRLTTAAILGLWISPGFVSQVTGQDAEFSAAEIEFFENKIRPVLVEHCLECHGAQPEKLRGGLRLTSRPGMIIGGDSGPAIVPGAVDESLLVKAIEYDEFEMPPQGRLSEEQIEDIKTWIRLGAPDPRAHAESTATTPQIDIEAGKKFWAFRAAKGSRPPENLVDRNWPLTEIDQFILARLEESRLQPAHDVDRANLLRRVYYALIGLPPTPVAIEEFINSPNPIDEDLHQVVDKLLDSHHYGERWGRHWLDVARFAESSGGGRSLMFPHAWRFRDYVIDSFNQDKPFDQFIKEQIAGDLLPFDSHDQQSEQIVATGFLALGPTNYEQQDKERLRMEVVDEQVDTVGRAFLALTLGCARCHDHKFDPIPTSDYYALAGIFQSTKSLVDGNVSSYVERSLATDEEKQAQAVYKAKVTELTKQLKDANEHVQRLGGTAAKVRSSQNARVPIGKLPGIVVDNTEAKLTGSWKDSVVVPRYVGQGYIHDDGQPKGNNLAVFSPEFPSGGHFEVRVSYSPGGNRASNVPVTINHQDGIAKKVINQSQDPPVDNLFVSLGIYRFEANNVASVTISNEDTDGVVIVDAVQFLRQNDAEVQPEKAATSRIAPSNRSETESIDDSRNTLPESRKIKAAKARVKKLDRELKELKKNAPHPVAKAMSVKDVADSADGHIHIRGEVRNLGDKVPRGFIRVVCREPATPEIPDASSGRLQLANWIASPDHPLTARVYVNRVWRHLFGTGLVETTDNFGNMGQRPSHPQLLDYLALRFVEQGWSTKKLIREIVTSRVFRLSTAGNIAAHGIDPENRLLWRANRRRMDAEVLRDSVLAVSGELDLTRGGLTIRKIEQYDLGYQFNSSRRGVYVPAFRNSMLDLFEVFDIANPNLVIGHRNTSTLPTQALYLMNSPWVIKRSQAAADRLLNEIEADPECSEEAKLNLAYLRTLGRYPTGPEAKLSAKYLQRIEDGAAEHQAWASLFHALFASLDFRYIN